MVSKDSSQITPKISVVIPVYNRAKTIIKALASVQAQTYTNWEVIVVDDGSEDGTPNTVRDICKKDQRIRLIESGQHKGAQTARNIGIKSAKANWVAFLDSDDQWLPESLVLRLEVAKNEKFHVIHSGAFIQHAEKPLEIYHLPALKGQVYRDVLSKEGPMFQGLLVTKKALERINYLDEAITAYQEWDTSIRLAKYFEFGYEPRPTFIYNCNCSDSISRDNVRNGKGYEQVFHKHFSAILWHLGPDGLAFHYEKAVSWYRDGNDLFDARRCFILATFWKCLSVKRVIKKILYGLFKKSK